MVLKFFKCLWRKLTAAPRFVETPHWIDNYPQLHGTSADGQSMLVLFKALRQEILALDSRIIEEPRTIHVAYKLQTDTGKRNFVDILPHADTLRLELIMPFSGLRDPKGLAQEMPSRPHGRVSVGAHDELPDVMALIRQALDDKKH